MITELSNIGLNVVAVISECGGGNVGLWNELGITCTRAEVKNSFAHPVTGQKIYVFADTPHMLKLIRFETGVLYYRTEPK